MSNLSGQEAASQPGSSGGRIVVDLSREKWHDNDDHWSVDLPCPHSDHKFSNSLRLLKYRNLVGSDPATILPPTMCSINDILVKCSDSCGTAFHLKLGGSGGDQSTEGPRYDASQNKYAAFQVMLHKANNDKLHEDIPPEGISNSLDYITWAGTTATMMSEAEIQAIRTRDQNELRPLIVWGKTGAWQNNGDSFVVKVHAGSTSKPNTLQEAFLQHMDNLTSQEPVRYDTDSIVSLPDSDSNRPAGSAVSLSPLSRVGTASSLAHLAMPSINEHPAEIGVHRTSVDSEVQTSADREPGPSDQAPTTHTEGARSRASLRRLGAWLRRTLLRSVTRKTQSKALPPTAATFTSNIASNPLPPTGMSATEEAAAVEDRRIMADIQQGQRSQGPETVGHPVATQQLPISELQGDIPWRESRISSKYATELPIHSPSES